MNETRLNYKNQDRKLNLPLGWCEHRLHAYMWLSQMDVWLQNAIKAVETWRNGHIMPIHFVENQLFFRLKSKVAFRKWANERKVFANNMLPGSIPSKIIWEIKCKTLQMITNNKMKIRSVWFHESTIIHSKKTNYSPERRCKCSSASPWRSPAFPCPPPSLHSIDTMTRQDESRTRGCALYWSIQSRTWLSEFIYKLQML